MRACSSLLAVALAASAPLSAFAQVSENFDGVTAPALPDGWTSATAAGALSDAPWASRAVGYAQSQPNAAWLDDVDDYADISLVSPLYALPSAGVVSFQHSFTLWAPDASDQANGAYSGGVLEISIDGGAYQDVVAAGGSFSAGGYTTALDPTFDNPLQAPPALNRAVWGGDSAGFITTTVNLPAAATGHNIRLRWRLGTAGGGSVHDTHSGWWIDDFSCTTCTDAGDDEIFKDGFDG